MPLAELDDIAFFSQHPIDKVVEQGTITIVNDGDSSWYQEAKIVTDSASHSYGRACLARARWSIDGGTSYQGMNTQIIYTFTVNTEAGDPGHPTSVTLYGLDSAISIGCDTDTVYFRTANGKHGTVTGTVTPSYTPTSRTFLIEYALYEWD